jgi:hypothetical protein
MTDNPSRPEHSADGDREVLTGPPRWVKISAIVGGIIVLIIVAVMLLTGGQHGPARHLGMGTVPSSAIVLQSGEPHPAGGLA